MSTAPPPWDPAEDPDEQYRRASALDPSRPSEATRHAVLSHAARLAAGRARADARRRWLSFAGIASGWRPALAGTLAAAVLAGVLIAPQLLTPRPAPPFEAQSAPVAARSALPSAPVATAPAPTAAAGPVEAVRPVAAVHPTKGAPPSAPANALQEVQVTASARRARSEPTPIAQAAPAAAADTAVNRPVDVDTAARYAPRGTVEESVSAVRMAPSSAMASARAAPAPAPVPFEARALQRAAATGDMATLTAQLAAAGDLDMPDAHGRTALLLAALYGQKGAVAALLARGANPNAADEHGTTPLAAALAAGEPEIATLLRHYGAR
jgi:hypothetical protein